MEFVRLSDVSIEVAVARAAAVLKKGGIVLFPTDTLYGLAVDATNPKALAALRELKGREKRKPISIVVPTTQSISQYAVMSDAARSLVERFLPGALTLVIPATNAIPDELTLNGSVGIRIPDDEFCLLLASEFGKPYTATSANRSGSETLDTASRIIEQFEHAAQAIDLIIDDGPRNGKEPSTIVAVIDGLTTAIREDAIPRTQLGM